MVLLPGNVKESQQSFDRYAYNRDKFNASNEKQFYEGSNQILFAQTDTGDGIFQRSSASESVYYDHVS